MIIAGILVFAGSYFLNERGFQLAKLTGFISNIKSATLETVHPEQAKEQVQVSRPDIPEHAVMEPKIVSQKVPKENLEPETRTKNKEVSYLDSA